MKRILGLLGWLGVVLVLAAVAIRFLGKPEWTWSGQWSQGLALAGLVVTAIYALSQWRDIGRSFSGRNVKYGSVAAGSIAVFLAILVAVNWIANRQTVRWDLTAAKQYSMSDQTKKIVGDLQKPVQVRVYFDSGTSSEQQYQDLLGEYAGISKLFTVEYLDYAKVPMRAKEDDITVVPTIILTSDGRTERTSTADESGVTNSLKRLLEGKAKKIYFVQGHGEHDTASDDPRVGYATLAAALKTDNFDVAKFTLAMEGKVPDDATMVIVAGPKTDFLPAEVDTLRGYLRRGGKLMLMIDPPEKTDSPQPTALIALAHEWGIDVGNNIVIDASGIGRMFGANEAVPIAMPSQGMSPITKDFQVMTMFPIARSAEPAPGGVNGHTAQALLETSPRSWAETDLKELYSSGQPKLDQTKGDKPGPVTIATSSSAPATETAPGGDATKNETRLIVFGDSDFVANGAINVPSVGNKDLALNAANWLAQQEDMIAIRPRDPADRRISMTADQANLVTWLTLVVIPLVLIGNGVRVWWKKR